MQPLGEVDAPPLQDSRTSGTGFDATRQRLAREYHRRSRRIALLGLGLSLLGLLAVITTGVSQALQSAAETVSPNPWAVVALYFLMGTALTQTLGLPLGMLSHRLEMAYGLSRQPWVSWAWDAAKGLLLSSVFGLAAVETLYWLLRNLGPWWWPAVWALGLAVSVVMSYVAPILLMPLFHRYEPLEEGEVKGRLMALARRAGLNPVDIYRMGAAAKTSRGMAALAGVGGTRRVIISDTLFQTYTPEETEAVFAHELGHHAHRDVARGFALGAAKGLLALAAVDLGLRSLGPPLGLPEPTAVATLPLILLILNLVGLALGPLGNFASRSREVAADRFALALTGNSDAFASAMVKIHDQNLSDAHPHPLVEVLFFSHPAGHRRVAMARRWSDQAGP